MGSMLFLTPDRWSHDPRARRAARAAGEAGWSTVAIDVSDDSAAADGATALVHVPPGRTTVALRRAGLGGPGRSDGPLARELRGVFRLLRMLALTIRMVRAARRTGQVAVVHANDAETLPAAVLVARSQGARLVYDAHEIYSSQEPRPPHVFRFVSLRLERALAGRAAAVVTVSPAIAADLQQRLRLRRAPLVVMNCPPVTAAPEPRVHERRARVIYQGAMGPGRYVTDLLELASEADGFELAIRVVGLDTEELGREIARRGLGDRVRVLDPVPPDDLIGPLADFDIGLVINRPVTRNDELVLPNKLFEYLMAGLAVVAPRLPSLSDVVDGERLGATYEPGSPADAARALNELAADPAALVEVRRRARAAALARYNAEMQRSVLSEAWGL
jgi:glycosyltransferase involved in cell wall biosynthesis